MGKIVVVGSLNMDLVAATDEIPKIGETVMGRTLSYICGGKGGNQAVAAAKMGAEVKMIGCVGDDQFGGMLKAGLTKYGVNAEAVGEVGGQASGTALITVKDGDNSIIVIPGANFSVSPAFVKQYLNVLDQADIILLQLEIPTETVLHIVRYARKNNLRVMLNPAPAKPLNEEVLNGLTYVIVNETESEYYTGIGIETQEDMAQNIQKLKELGVVHPIITLGGRGVVFEEADKLVHIPAREVRAVDTTAAGDTFAAAMAARLIEGESLSQAAEFATAASSIVVTRSGAQTSIPELQEVMELL